MKQNYLYKCTDCSTVQAADEDLGLSTWALSCRACGQIVTEHYAIDIQVAHHIGLDVKLMCPKEKEDNDTNTGTDKKESVDEH